MYVFRRYQGQWNGYSGRYSDLPCGLGLSWVEHFFVPPPSPSSTFLSPSYPHHWILFSSICFWHLFFASTGSTLHSHPTSTWQIGNFFLCMLLHARNVNVDMFELAFVPSSMAFVFFSGKNRIISHFWSAFWTTFLILKNIFRRAFVI